MKLNLKQVVEEQIDSILSEEETDIKKYFKNLQHKTGSDKILDQIIDSLEEDELFELLLKLEIGD